MKPIITAFMLFSFYAAHAQKIKQSEYDKFVKEYRIETNGISVKAGLANSMAYRIRSIDTNIYIIVSGYGKGASVIGEKDEMIFLFDNDSTCTAFSTGLQDYNIGQYANTYTHQYAISLHNVEMLQRLKVKSIRMYSARGYADQDINENAAEKLSDLAKVFLNEYDSKVSQFGSK